MKSIRTLIIFVSVVIIQIGFIKAQDLAFNEDHFHTISGLSETDTRVNYSFNGIQNVSRSGVCIPLIYGEVFCGSIVVSSGTDTAPVFAN